MPAPTVILSGAGVRRALARMAHEIAERNEGEPLVGIVGIQRGGMIMAERLGSFLGEIWGRPVPVGTLDVGMHRDDLGNHSLPNILPTHIPFDITGNTIVLADDVLFSGRTVRAALDALNDFGRPRRIQLAVLIDRGHRELPIKPDFIGKNVPTSLAERINVQWGAAPEQEGVYLEKM